MKEKSYVCSFSIPLETLMKIDRECRIYQITRSRFIQNAVARYLRFIGELNEDAILPNEIGLSDAEINKGLRRR